MDDNVLKYFWGPFVRNLRGNVPPATMPFLNNPSKCTGKLTDEGLTVLVDSEFTKAVTDKPDVLEGISQTAKMFFGRETPVKIELIRPLTRHEILGKEMLSAELMMSRERVFDLVIGEVKRKREMAMADENKSAEHLEVADALLRALRAYVLQNDR